MPDDLPGRQMVEGKYSLAPLFMIDINTELVVHVGVAQGEKFPIITDRNPHLEVGRGIGRILNIGCQNLADSRRCVYMPYNEEANMVMDLPNTAGMFFTTQKVKVYHQ